EPRRPGPPEDVGARRDRRPRRGRSPVRGHPRAHRARPWWPDARAPQEGGCRMRFRGMDRLVVATLASVALVAPAAGAPQQSVCRFTALQNHVLAPVDLTFPINATGVSANVTIDDSTGSFSLDGGSIVVPPYPMPFSDANDVLVFETRIVPGTIDQSGSVTVPGVNFTICTRGTPAGTDCAPSNMCSNDTSRICIAGAGGGTGCDAPGVCQGV